jgi:hypothetical protein
MSNKQNDHYQETLKEANQERRGDFENAVSKICELYWLRQLQKQNDEWWTIIDQDEEWQENDLEMYPNDEEWQENDLEMYPNE